MSQLRFSRRVGRGVQMLYEWWISTPPDFSAGVKLNLSVHVWDPNGTLLGKIYTGGVVANFNFTKDGIWMMGEERLFFCELGARGTLVNIECV